MANGGPRDRFYKRHAAFIVLGIEPDGTTWKELRQQIEDKKLHDPYKRALKRLREFTSAKDIMAYAVEAVKAGVPDVPDKPVSTPRVNDVIPERAPKNPVKREGTKKAHTSTKRDEKSSDFLARVKAQMNGASA